MLIIFQVVLILFFLVFFLVACQDMKRGVDAVLFFLPAYLVRFSLGGIPTTVLEVMIYLLLAAGFVRKDRGHFSGAKRMLQADKFLAGGLILLLGGALLSTLCSDDLRTSLGALKGWFFDPFLFFLAYLSVVCSEEEMRATLRALAYSCGAVALLALSYALAGEFTFDGRLRAFYESPNYLAMQLAPGFLVAAHCFLSERVSGARRRWGALLLLTGSALFWTRSYGALLGVLAGLGAYLFSWYRQQGSGLSSARRCRWLLIVALGVIVFGCLSYQKYEQILHSSQRSSLHSRLMIWDASRLMLEDSPLVGIGPGTFQANYLAYQGRFATPYLEWAVTQPHNTMLAFYLQTGFLGLLGFGLLLLWLLRRARPRPALLLLLAYFLVHGAVDTLYWKNDLSILFFLLLGLAFASEKRQPRMTETPPGAV